MEGLLGRESERRKRTRGVFGLGSQSSVLVASLRFWYLIKNLDCWRKFKFEENDGTFLWGCIAFEMPMDIQEKKKQDNCIFWSPEDRDLEQRRFSIHPHMSSSSSIIPYPSSVHRVGPLMKYRIPDLLTNTHTHTHSIVVMVVQFQNLGFCSSFGSGL